MRPTIPIVALVLAGCGSADPAPRPRASTTTTPTRGTCGEEGAPETCGGWSVDATWVDDGDGLYDAYCEHCATPPEYCATRSCPSLRSVTDDWCAARGEETDTGADATWGTDLDLEACKSGDLTLVRATIVSWMLPDSWSQQSFVFHDETGELLALEERVSPQSQGFCCAGSAYQVPQLRVGTMPADLTCEPAVATTLCPAPPPGAARLNRGVSRPGPARRDPGWECSGRGS